MDALSSAPAVAALTVAAVAAAVLAAERLRRRRRPSLRGKLIALVFGMVAAEAAMLPALAAALWGEALAGLAPAAADPWVLAAGYAAVTVYVVVRLFPWAEVDAIAGDPDARLGDVIARIAAERRRDSRRDDPG